MITVFGTLKTTNQPSVRSDSRAGMPIGELHDGISRVMISTYGDDPSDVFIQVTGTDERACLDAYDRTFHALKLVLPWIWGGDTPTVRVELTDDGEELLRIEIPMDLVGWRQKDALDAEGLGLRGIVLR